MTRMSYRQPPCPMRDGAFFNHVHMPRLVARHIGRECIGQKEASTVTGPQTSCLVYMRTEIRMPRFRYQDPPARLETAVFTTLAGDIGRASQEILTRAKRGTEEPSTQMPTS